MRVHGFWRGAALVAERTEIAGLARTAGGWEAFEEGGPALWRELGLTAGEVHVLARTPPGETRGVALYAVDPRYPPELLGLPNAPPVLFVEGDLAALEPRAVSVVGTRRCTPYGISVARDLGARLAEAGFTVVSGLARGIDHAAHEGALTRGRTVAVLGHGLGHTAPSSHRGLRARILRSGGAMVSSWPDDVPPRPFRFPLRNHWIAGLSEHTVVVEAPLKSGAGLTAKFANDQSREVWAVPGPMGSLASEGCHALVRDGCAALLPSVAALLEALSVEVHARDAWLSALFAGARLEEVAVLRGGSVAELIEVLQRMEALGEVVRLPGWRYASR